MRALSRAGPSSASAAAMARCLSRPTIRSRSRGAPAATAPARWFSTVTAARVRYAAFVGQALAHGAQPVEEHRVRDEVLAGLGSRGREARRCGADGHQLAAEE